MPRNRQRRLPSDARTVSTETRKGSAPSSGAAAGLGCLFLALYVLPLYAPPLPNGIPTIDEQTGLWARLFPHVPVWSAMRLAALALGAGFIAWAGRGVEAFVAPAPAAESVSPPSTATAKWCERIALAIAALLCLISALPLPLSHWAQFVLVLGLTVPALVLRVADASDDTAPRQRDPETTRWWIAVAVLVGAWTVWRILLAQHDSRAADLVDMWKNFTFFLDAGTKPQSDMAQSYEVGVSSIYLFAIGLPFISSGLAEPTFAWVQGFHTFWIILSAFGVAELARRIGGPVAMLPAVAALLFSPFMLSMAVCIAPFGLMTALAVGIALLVARIYERPRRADVAALGAIAGVSISLPHLTLLATLGSIAVVPFFLRRRPPWIVWIAAALTGLASLLPALTNLLNVAGMSEMYLERRGAALELEQLILGQRFYTHREVAALWHSGIRGVFDVPIAAVLQPFAILRSPVRLSGDVQFEPIAAALAAVGLLACLLRLRRSRTAQILIVVMAIGMFPAAASATDRASLTRNLLLPVLLPLFTVAGLHLLEVVVRGRLSPSRTAVAVTALIAASGAFIFDRINPQILPRTWLGLALDAVAATPADQVLLLEPGNPPNDWLHVAEIGRYLPRQPIATRSYQNGGSLLGSADADAVAAPLLSWSPALEEQMSVAHDLCSCWPQSTIFRLRDRAGLSRALVARVDGKPWSPSLPAPLWSAERCPPADRQGCPSLRAKALDTRAQQRARSGDAEGAVADLRRAIELDSNAAPPHVTLGLLYDEHRQTAQAVQEYRTAIALDPDLAAPHNNLAIALENLGQPDEAIAHYFESLRLEPNDARSHLNLGAALAGRGRGDEALAQYREALRLAPYMPEAHFALADALEQRGELRAAIAEYGAALRDRPGWPPASNALAWLLATVTDPSLRDPQEAVKLAADAVQKTGNADVRALRTLAVAQAAAGDIEEARRTAARAVELARASGQESLVSDLDARIGPSR